MFFKHKHDSCLTVYAGAWVVYWFCYLFGGCLTYVLIKEMFAQVPNREALTGVICGFPFLALFLWFMGERSEFVFDKTIGSVKWRRWGFMRKEKHGTFPISELKQISVDSMYRLRGEHGSFRLVFHTSEGSIPFSWAYSQGRRIEYEKYKCRIEEFIGK